MVKSKKVIITQPAVITVGKRMENDYVMLCIKAYGEQKGLVILGKGYKAFGKTIVVGHKFQDTTHNRVTFYTDTQPVQGKDGKMFDLPVLIGLAVPESAEILKTLEKYEEGLWDGRLQPFKRDK